LPQKGHNSRVHDRVQSLTCCSVGKNDLAQPRTLNAPFRVQNPSTKLRHHGITNNRSGLQAPMRNVIGIAYRNTAPLQHRTDGTLAARNAARNCESRLQAGNGYLGFES